MQPPRFPPQDLWSAPAESLWFPLSLATLGALLLALGLVASCGSWGTRTATLHLVRRSRRAPGQPGSRAPQGLCLSLHVLLPCLASKASCCTLHLTPPPFCCLLQFNGATLVLLPGELGLSAIWWSGSPLLRRFALLDTSNTFTALLDWLGANKALATLAGAAFLCLQLAVLVLGTCVGCCTPAPRKYPWSQYWDDPRVSGGWEARDPLLPQLTRSAPTSAGGWAG